MVGKLWHRDQTGRVTGEQTLEEAGFVIAGEQSSTVILPAKGKVVIPISWLTWQAASSNLRVKIGSAEMKSTISGRWTLRAIQDGLQHPVKSLEEASADVEYWAGIPDFALVSTRGQEDMTVRVFTMSAEIQVWDTSTVEEAVSGEGKKLFFFNGYKGVHTVKKNDGVRVVSQRFQDSFEEKKFNQTMINMCQGLVTLEHMLQFTKVSSDPMVDALLVTA